MTKIEKFEDMRHGKRPEKSRCIGGKQQKNNKKHVRMQEKRIGIAKGIAECEKLMPYLKLKKEGL